MKKQKRLWRIFFDVLLCVLVLGGVSLLSVYLVKGMQKTEKPEKAVSSTVETVEFPTITTRPKEKKEEPVFAGKYGEILADAERMKKENIHAKEGMQEDTVTLIFGGDILFDSDYAVMASSLQRENPVENAISDKVRSKMKEADICMVNNEFPYSLRGEPLPEKAFTFRAKPEYAKFLHTIGVDLVSLANNHAYDHGEVALLDTFAALEENGIPYIGAGRNIAEASRPIYFIINDIKVGILSATQIERLDNPDTKGATENTPGVFRCLKPEKLLEQISKTKEECDFLIIYVHWGTENQTELDWLQTSQAPEYVKAGADMIIGDHPHCLQPMEYIDGVPVVYSLGNFWFSSKTLDTALVQVTIDKEGLKEWKFIPCKQENCTTGLLEREEASRLITYMNEISPKIYIDENGVVSPK